MKKLIFIALTCIGVSLTAQTKEEVEHFMDLFGMEKVQVVNNLIHLDEENQQAFYDLYDEYVEERRAQGLHRYEMINHYIQDYSSYDEENVAAVIKESMRMRAERDKIIRKYYEKIKKEINPVAAAQFYQIEHYFLSEINVALVEQLPLIGEIKN